MNYGTTVISNWFVATQRPFKVICLWENSHVEKFRAYFRAIRSSNCSKDYLSGQKCFFFYCTSYFKYVSLIPIWLWIYMYFWLLRNSCHTFTWNVLGSKNRFIFRLSCILCLFSQNCLGLIYTVYIENLSQSIENIIAKLLLIKSPPPGSSVVRFSIGAADKQALQTPQSDLLPVTRSSVTVLLRQLGM